LRSDSIFWLPSAGEERYLNLIALALVLILLALGFDILKLPSVISPDRPPLPQLVGLGAILTLSLVLTWVAARDDYLRFRHGFPRVLATFILLSALVSGAFLIRGWWAGIYTINLAQRVNCRDALTVLIGGQFTVIAFFSTFLLKKGETADVRKFKKSANAIRSFVAGLCDGTLTGESYENAYEVAKGELASISAISTSLQLIVDKTEAKFASEFAAASARVAAVLAVAPTQSEARETVNRTERESCAVITDRQKSRKAQSGAAA